MAICTILLHFKKYLFPRRLLLSRLSYAALFLHLSPAVVAQDTDALFNMSLEDLLQQPITGSHIKHRNNTAAANSVSIIDRNTIEQSGAISLEALLQQLPLSAGYAGNQSNAYWSNLNSNGTTHVNLRGLGINRTLVLLNGRRLAYGGSGANAAVDLNTIPLAIIERIEILKDGASAIYGADAVAGVVNIITRTGLQGGEAQLHYGETFVQDGKNHSADLSWGANNERGSLFLSLSHSQGGAINMADRAPCGLGEVGGQLTCVDSGNTIGGRALLANGQSVNFNQTPGGSGDFYEPYSATKHNFNANSYLNAVNPIERTSLSGFGSLILGNNFSAFAEFLYSQRDSNQLASPGTIGLNRPINIAATHPTNPTGQDLVLQRRRLLEGGTRDLFQDIESLMSVIGIKGQLDDNWDWSLALNYRRNSATDGSTNIVNLNKIEQTLDINSCSSALGAPTPCADYLGYGDINQAVIDYLMLTTRDRGGNQQKGISAGITGEAFQLPAGKVAIASGIELRSDHSWRHPDPLAIEGIANVSRQQPTDGKFSAREVFAEVHLPLLKELPMIEALTLSSAVRYSDYELSDNVTNYKWGLDWTITNTFSLRSNYATAFRAPNVPELFAGNFNSNLITNDPCSNWRSLPPESVVASNCQGEGLAPNFQQLVTSILTTQGGNTQLQPEQAKTLITGALWAPSENFHLTLDYFEIDIEDAISQVSGSTKLAACYNSPGRSHPFCSSNHFTRNAISGQIDYLSIQQGNAASETISGVDIGAHYQFALGSWDAKLNWATSYLHQYDLQAFEGASTTQFAGSIVSGRGSYAQQRSLGGISLVRGSWSGSGVFQVSYSMQYIDAMTDLNAPEGSIGRDVPSVTYHHIHTQYSPDESLTFTLGIDNVFNRQAPFVRNWLDVNTDTMTYDVQGRRWFIKAAYHW